MHFNSLLTALATAASLAGAFPAAEPISKRACTLRYPNFPISFTSTSPDTNTLDTTLTLARTGGPGSNTGKAGLTFSGIPAGATGCALHYALPPVTTPDQFATGANNVDVFGADGPILRTTTWNNQPHTTTKYASIQVPEYVTDRYETILLATTCNATLSFLFQLSDWQQNAGTVHIPQNPTASGFWLTYDC